MAPSSLGALVHCGSRTQAARDGCSRAEASVIVSRVTPHDRHTSPNRYYGTPLMARQRSPCSAPGVCRKRVLESRLPAPGRARGEHETSALVTYRKPGRAGEDRLRVVRSYGRKVLSEARSSRTPVAGQRPNRCPRRRWCSLLERRGCVGPRLAGIRSDSIHPRREARTGSP